MLVQELQELELLSQQKHSELAELAEEELSVCRLEINDLQTSLINTLIPRDKADEHSAVLEVRAGECSHTLLLLSDVCVCVCVCVCVFLR